MVTSLRSVGFVLAFLAAGGSAFAEDASSPAVPKKAVAPAAEKEIVITILADGRVMLEGRRMTLDELELQLRDSLKNKPKPVVRMKGEGPMPYSTISHVAGRVAELCRDTGI